MHLRQRLIQANADLNVAADNLTSLRKEWNGDVRALGVALRKHALHRDDIGEWIKVTNRPLGSPMFTAVVATSLQTTRRAELVEYIKECGWTVMDPAHPNSKPANPFDTDPVILIYK